MATQTFKVQGMSCEHCVEAVTREVGKLISVSHIGIDLPSGTVTVESGWPVDRVAVAAAVDEAGFELAP